MSALHAAAPDILGFVPPKNWERFPIEPQRPHIHTSDNAQHIGPIIAAVTPLIIAIGVAIRWVLTKMWGRKETEFQELRKEVRELRAEVTAANNRLQIVTYHALAMSAKLRLTDPQSPELASWERVLHDVFPLDAESPIELLAKALRLDA